MSIHKLTAGSGYDYLTRQVARHDATQTGPSALADYYTAQGEAPGVWVGSGLAGITGLEVSCFSVNVALGAVDQTTLGPEGWVVLRR